MRGIKDKGYDADKKKELINWKFFGRMVSVYGTVSPRNAIAGYMRPNKATDNKKHQAMSMYITHNAALHQMAAKITVKPHQAVTPQKCTTVQRVSQRQVTRRCYACVTSHQERME